MDDPTCEAAMSACHDATAGIGAVQNARIVFEAAASQVEILDERGVSGMMEGRLTSMVVQTASTEDRNRLIATILLAFSADPAARWTYPSPEAYLQHFPDIIRALGGKAFDCGTAHFIGDVEAASLWLPPGVQPDEEAFLDTIHRTISEPDQEALFAVIEQMASYHPNEPHWYLPLIGADPIQQRKGHGSILLEHVLRDCDRDDKPAYLESSNPINIPLYKRHGFEILGEIQVGTSPPITPMLRKPR